MSDRPRDKAREAKLFLNYRWCPRNLGDEHEHQTKQLKHTIKNKQLVCVRVDPNAT